MILLGLVQPDYRYVGQRSSTFSIFLAILHVSSALLTEAGSTVGTVFPASILNLDLAQPTKSESGTTHVQ
jgi:hypothetical protein